MSATDGNIPSEKSPVDTSSHSVTPAVSSQTTLQRIAEALPGVIYQFRLAPDGTQRFLFMSRGSEELLGVPAQEIVQDFSKAWASVWPEDIPVIEAATRASAETLQPWMCDFRVTTRQGETKWLRGRSVPDPPLPDGTIVWNGLFLDVTEYICAEKSLEHSEQRLRRLVEGAPVAICVMRDGIIIFANKTAAEMVGLSASTDLIGQKLVNFLPPAMRATMTQRFALIAQGLEPAEQTFYGTGQRADGTEFPIYTEAFPVDWPDGPARVMFAFDLSEMKQADLALSQSNERFQALFAVLPLGVMLMRDGLVIDANPAVTRMCGCATKEELIGTQVLQWVAPQHRAPIADRIARRKRGEVPPP